MRRADESWFDPDIAAMQLDYGEKAGLQIYRNYTQAFEENAIKRFVETLDHEQLDLADLRKLLKLVRTEDPRFLPVIVCGFADELLKSTFKAALPDGIPGGKGRMFTGYGPLSDLARRIQLAFAFDVLSSDLMQELNRIRITRNDIAHNWNTDTLEEFWTSGQLVDIHPIEGILSERKELEVEFSAGFEPLTAFRIRLAWIAGRLFYEAATYNRAKEARVRPAQALYGKPAPRRLAAISKLCLDTTRQIANRT
jgi:hypothetical protein